MENKIESIEHLIDQFFQTFPPVWREVRVKMRSTVLENFDITFEQFHTLRRIHQGHDRVSKLADDKRISRPAISRSVDVLVNKGLVSRTINPHDRRQIKLELTPEGDILMDGIFKNNRIWMAEVFSQLDHQELTQVTDALSTIYDIFFPPDHPIHKHHPKHFRKGDQ